MKKNYAKEKVNFLVIETIIVVLAIAVFLLLYSGGLSEILSVIIGVLVARVATNVVLFIRFKHEDENKLSESDYAYDESYLTKLTFCDKQTDLWYAPCVNDVNATYVMRDKDEFIYKLPTFIETNYMSLMSAHSASFIRNQTMIRFDDYTYNKEKNEVTVDTSRTTFFNDLVTNRVVDYKIDGEISVRNVYENRNFLTPLKESAFSNHIGINAMVFFGDELLFTLRGSTGTISKNMLTSTVAIGVKEEDYVNEYSFEENIRERIVANKLLNIFKFKEEKTGNDLSEEKWSFLTFLKKKKALRNLSEEEKARLKALEEEKAKLEALEEKKALCDLLAEGKIKIYCMGFGRHIYMGGKPQFYYAVTVEQGCAKVKTKKAKMSNVIDFNERVIPIKCLELSKENDYILKLTTSDGKVLKREAERSFFVNYWHVVSQDRISGIPDWLYDGAVCKTKENTNDVANEEKNTNNAAGDVNLFG